MTPARDPDPPARLGRYMIVAAWIGVLVLLMALFKPVLDRRINPNTQIDGAVLADGTREVVLERNRAGHYVADGRINGHGVTFLLDTGATVVSVPGELARRLGLPVGAPVRAVTASGVVTTYATRLDRVELGPIVGENVSAQINPHMPGQEVLLGMSFLRNLEFTQRGRTLTLRQSPG